MGNQATSLPGGHPHKGGQGNSLTHWNHWSFVVGFVGADFHCGWLKSLFSSQLGLFSNPPFLTYAKDHTRTTPRDTEENSMDSLVKDVIRPWLPIKRSKAIIHCKASRLRSTLYFYKASSSWCFKVLYKYHYLNPTAPLWERSHLL